MINVAICDDVVSTTGKIETMLQNIAKRNFMPVDTDVFWKGEHLVDSVEMGNSFDIIFLDIEMGQEDGIRHTFLSCTDFLYNFNLSVCWYFEI